MFGSVTLFHNDSISNQTYLSFTLPRTSIFNNTIDISYCFNLSFYYTQNMSISMNSFLSNVSLFSTYVTKMVTVCPYQFTCGLARKNFKLN